MASSLMAAFVAGLAFGPMASVLAAEVFDASMLQRMSVGECWDTDLPVDATYFPVSFQAQSDPSMAHLFEIAYADTFKVITSSHAQEQYVLTQCGQSQPGNVEVEAVTPLASGFTRKYFEVPLRSVIATSTVQLGFLDALEVQDRVRYVSEFVSAPCWQKAFGCGAALESTSGNQTLLAQQHASVDAVFLDCGNDCSSVNSQANAVHVPTSQDSGVLATAEYIKYLGAFFNKEPLANSFFAATKASYRHASPGSSGGPVVAWISYSEYAGPNWDQKAFLVSQATYKTDLVTDAGGANLDAAAALANVPGLTVSDAVYSNPSAGKTYTLPLSAFNDNKADASAAFFEALAGVDVVVDAAYAWNPNDYTFETFLSTYGLTSDSSLKFVVNQMVLRFDRTLTPAYSLDWYESRVARPDFAVEGLARELHEDESKRAKYFRNVAKGQTPDQVLSSSMCSKTLPACDENAIPAAIETPGPVLATPDTSKAAPHAAAKWIAFSIAATAGASASVGA